MSDVLGAYSAALMIRGRSRCQVPEAASSIQLERPEVTKSSLFLAIDVGASRTAAAIARVAADGLVTPIPFPLGRHTDSVPSLIFVGDGELLFGDAAERRGIAQPERLIREFKRRIGDSTPIRAGDRRFASEQLFALLVSWVVDCVAEREGELPTALSV